MSAFKSRYSYKDGFHIDKRFDAQVVGEMCENLSNTIGLTPKTLLDANRDEDTPLHDYFEWRDDVAAEKYRESQASYIIRSIIIVSDEENKPTVRAYNSVVIDTKPTYKHIDTIVKSVDLTQQMLESAKNELFAFQTKYNALRNYAELSEVFTVINKLRKDD